MKLRFLTRAFRFNFARPATAGIVFFLAAVAAAYGGDVELLSDACIADISAGNGDVVSLYFETPTTAYIDETSWWGDMNGVGSGCAIDPGFVVTNIPYVDFQYDQFKYSFKDQASADKFVNDLAPLNANVIDTDYIKSRPNADNIFSGDNTKPRIKEIIFTTDKKIDGNFVRAHNGEVIEQDVRFDLEFLPPYLKSYTIRKSPYKGGNTALERSLSLRNYDRWEWVPGDKMRTATGLQDKTYNFGTVFTEPGTTGDDPILSESGLVVVPPHTAYVRNRIYNDIHIHSPAFGMSIGLAPQGDPIRSDLVWGDQTHYPDFTRYQELGMLEIKNLDIFMGGGNDIYIYPNEDWDVVCH